MVYRANPGYRWSIRDLTFALPWRRKVFWREGNPNTPQDWLEKGENRELNIHREREREKRIRRHHEEEETGQLFTFSSRTDKTNSLTGSHCSRRRTSSYTLLWILLVAQLENPCAEINWFEDAYTSLVLLRNLQIRWSAVRLSEASLTRVRQSLKRLRPRYSAQISLPASPPAEVPLQGWPVMLVPVHVPVALA